MDVYEDEKYIRVLHLDVELQGLFGASSSVVTSNLNAPGDQPPIIPIRKDRLLFTAAPPEPLPADAPEFHQRVVIVSNIHWALSDADLIDGSCTYGPVARVYIFEDPRRSGKSDGIALVEFRTLSGAEAALEDEGLCWSSKQGDRRVHVTVAPTEATKIMEQLTRKYGCWTRVPQLPEAIIDAVYNKVGRNRPTLTTATLTSVQQHLPIPIAVQALLTKYCVDE